MAQGDIAIDIANKKLETLWVRSLDTENSIGIFVPLLQQEFFPVGCGSQLQEGNDLRRLPKIVGENGAATLHVPRPPS